MFVDAKHFIYIDFRGKIPTKMHPSYQKSRILECLHFDLAARFEPGTCGIKMPPYLVITARSVNKALKLQRKFSLLHELRPNSTAYHKRPVFQAIGSNSCPYKY